MIKPLRNKGLVHFVTSRYWVHPSNSKARRCRTVGIASIVAVGPLSSSRVIRHTFWLCVASPSSRDRKFCTGSPWAFWCVFFFALAEADGWAGRTGSRVPRLAWISSSAWQEGMADYRLWLIGQRRRRVEVAAARLLLRPPPSNRTGGIAASGSPKDFFLRRSRATTGQGHTQRLPAQQQQVVPPSAFRRLGMTTLASA